MIAFNLIRSRSTETARFSRLLFQRSFFNRGSAPRQGNRTMERNRQTAYYILGGSVIFGGLGYAASPLYRKFCQATGLGGTTRRAEDFDKIEDMSVRKDRLFKVRFQSDVNKGMQWTFVPEQDEIWVHPGETALAFFSAKNTTTRTIVGISTYNIVPFDAGAYFNKIQCFCFEEQMLAPGEEVDMPVFFFLDPEICEDPNLYGINELILGYTFFEVKKGMKLPVPSYAIPHNRSTPPVSGDGIANVA